MDIAGAIAAVTASIGLVKEIKEIDSSVDKANLRLKIADLTSALADAKLGLVEIRDELAQKDSRIASLQALLTTRDTTTAIHNNKRYFTNSAGEPAGAPICPICERSGYLLAMVQDRSRGTSGTFYTCPKCKANYGTHPGVLKSS